MPEQDLEININRRNLIKFSILSVGAFVLGKVSGPFVSTLSGRSNVSATGGSTADAEPPTTPTEVTKTGASATQLKLSWNPSKDNVGVKGYRVYRSEGDTQTSTPTPAPAPSPTPAPSTPAPAPSDEQTVPPLATLTDAQGAIWRLEPSGDSEGSYPMRNGSHYGGRAHLLKLVDGKIEAYNSNSGTWFRVNPEGGWEQIGVSQPSTPTPSPSPTPSPINNPSSSTGDTNPSHADGGPLPTFARSRMVYQGWKSTNGFAFIKHTQFMSSDDKYIRAFGGDLNQGIFPLDENSAVRQVGLNCVVRWDTSDNMRREQLVSRFGNPADGVAPYNHDGCTTVWTGDEVISVPGFAAPFRAVDDPHSIMQANISHAFIFNEATRSWRAGPLAGRDRWTAENWNGAYHAGSDRVYVMADNGTVSGALRVYNYHEPDESKAFITKQMSRAKGITDYGNIGQGFNASPWRSEIIDDVMYFVDPYRGWLWGVDVTKDMSQPYKVARIPKLYAVGEEQIGSIELGTAVSKKLRKVWIGYSAAIYVEDGAAAIYEVDVDTGHVAKIPFPNEMGPEGDFKRMATMLAFSDATNTLVATGNSDEAWASRFLVFKYPDPVTAGRIDPLAWLGPIGVKSEAPNSVALGYFVNGGGINPSFLSNLGLTVPRSYGEIIRIPDNENGTMPQKEDGSRALCDRVWGDLRGFSGNFWDYKPRGQVSKYPVTMIVAGDSGNGVSQVAAYEFSNTGQWINDVVEGGHVSKFRNANNTIENAAALARGRVIDQREYKTLDGTSLTGCHRYFGSHFIRKRGLLLQVKTNNRYPRDMGNSENVVCADIPTKSWMFAEPVESAGPSAVETPITFSCKITGKVFAIRHNTSCVLNPDTLTWTRRSMRNTQDAILDDGCGGHDPVDSYQLMCSKDGLLPETNPLRWWIDEGGVMKTISLTGPGATLLDFTNQRWTPRDAALEWVPPWNAFAFYRGDGRIYMIKRSSGQVFNVEVWNTGAFPAIGELSDDAAGGVLTKMSYIENTCDNGSVDKFLAYHPSDKYPIFCVRVA